ncbi:46 kDa FK506-binding nuclear protein-like [Haliotis rubra]|uniref:46 kDa FK506-binding nuclear protein-like n=1 Tax=Haliotis rubra TaxID=36100 RepID=UPI001EE5ABFB|nr:46 kDa FK506-binding nuclear protein-like [Haliotis rubra]
MCIQTSLRSGEDTSLNLMVKLRDVQNMFWGVTLDGGKRYTQTVERSFHISMAALESGTDTPKTKEKHVAVMIQHEKAEFVMCTLEFGRLYQQPLDLNFTEGEEVTFFLNGTGIVHLTGYLLDEGQYNDEMGFSGDSSESDDEAPELLGMAEEDSDDDSDDSDDEDFAIEMALKKDAKKRKAKDTGVVQKKKSKLLSMNDDSEDLDSDDSDDDEELMMGADMEDDSMEEEDDEEEDDESEEAEEDQQVPAKSPKAKKQEKEKQPTKQTSADSASKQKSAGQNGVANTPGTEEKKKKKKKKKKNKNKEGAESQQNTPEKSSATKLTKDTPKSTPNQPKKDTPKPSASQTPKQTPKKRVVSGGVIVEDIKVGHGPEAKSGKQAQMYYVGTLQDGKQFDSCKGGKPFKFKLGKGEVIHGWDVGVSGMKVGGKRKLVIPPTMGYGKQRQGPIPPNSTLVFEVELKAVS